MRRVLIFSTSDFGGAGLYNKEILEGLRKSGFEVQMVVAKKRSDSSLITAVPLYFWQKVINKYGRYVPFTRQYKSLKAKNTANKDYYFLEPFEQSSLYTFRQILRKITIKPDVIVACWTSGFLTYEILGRIGTHFSAPTYVYTADMSPFTGGCHYAWNCEGYMHKCRECPALCSNTRRLASENLLKKKMAVEKYGIKAFAFSDFTYKQIKQSSLFKYQENIPSFQGIVSEDYFYVDNKSAIRTNYSIPENRIVVVLGALNLYERRKGFKELVNALNLVQRKKPELAKEMLLIAIGDEKVIECSIEIQFLPFTKNMKILGDYYRLADIYANASLEDSGPQMLIQAMACGAIPVSFNTGFGSELIDRVTGFKAPVGDIDAFSDMLIEAAELSDVKRIEMLNSIAEKIERDNSIKRLQYVFNSL